MIAGAGTRFDAAALSRRDVRRRCSSAARSTTSASSRSCARCSTLAPQPGAARQRHRRRSQPTDPDFSGFVFKIQANMNPRHRDRMAFVRGLLGPARPRTWRPVNERLGTTLRLSRVYRFFGRERETVPEAYPGDVVGLVNPGRLAIGDTLYAGRPVRYPPIPQFPAERFAYLRPIDVRHKRFDEAVSQLEEEGLMQVFMPQSGLRHPIIGVVGPLQFDVVEARLASEYGIHCASSRCPTSPRGGPCRTVLTRSR